MAPYAKDSAIVILRASENGYTASLYLWHQNPPPFPVHQLGNAGSPVRLEVIAADKAALKTQLATLVDNIFDQ